MPNLRNIKRRIDSVKSTQKITRAMKMVAASKLRRAQEAITRTRPYSHEMRRLISSLAARADRDLHPLLRSGGEGKKVGLVVITSDRGLCGSFNASIVNRALRELRTTFAEQPVELIMVGRKGIDAFRRRRIPLRATFTGLTEEDALRTATRIIDDLVAEYMRGETSAVYVLYNEFKSAISQKVTLEKLLPITPEPYEGHQPLDYLYEPSTEAVFEGLLVENLHIQMHRILYESAGSEFGARMTAMDAATNNAGDVISRLTLQYNRARQDAITKELIEVISGAEAL